MAEDAALQSRTVQVETVDVFMGDIIVKYGQVAGDCGNQTRTRLHNKQVVSGSITIKYYGKMLHSQFLVRQQVRLHFSAVSSW